ncbi:hypothetical protein Rhe02_55840 [Rhizocola hellebori]|uniref:Uncharacterized protein n=1 Tax=Rhizocola hellebori TaxID=1392758 RepID=A0A8J3QCI8_9ACTN|nr:hypothetical protein [Rhizocola hellebori]GIH07517.1 hypothetical protein Rhe02_55840 [Rhizocola hellebori]
MPVNEQPSPASTQVELAMGIPPNTLAEAEELAAIVLARDGELQRFRERISGRRTRINRRFV